jgi:MFS family permease
MRESGPGRQTRWWLALLVIFGLHVCQCLRCFPNWSTILSDEPIVQVDHALHLYHGWLGARFLRDYGYSWGYDPFFMAGYPKTPFHDPSSGLAELSLWLAGSSYSPAAYKLGLLLTMLTTPVLVAGGAWLLGCDRNAVALTVLVQSWYYWTGYSRVLLDSGLYGFLWGSAWTVVVLGLLSRWFARPTVGNWIGLAGATTISIFVHPTVAIMLLGPVTALYLGVGRFRGIRWHLATWLAAILAGLANGFWLVPMYRLWPLRQVQYVFMLDPPSFVFDYFVGDRFAQLLLLLAVVGLFVWHRSGRRSAMFAVSVMVLILFGLTFFGGLWKATQGLEPRRFLVPLSFWLAVAAGPAMGAIANRLTIGTARQVVRAAILAVAAGVVVLWLAQGRVFTIGYQMIAHRRPFSVGLKPPMLELVEWIRTHTNNSARILFEDQLRLLENTEPESVHWSCLLPILTGREFIGGQYQVTPLVHHVASFGDFHLAGRPVDTILPLDLAEILDRYNVGWIICWSPRAKLAFDAFTQARYLGSLPRYSTRPAENQYFLYRVDRRPSYFAQGTGRVVAVDLNRIELSDLVPDADTIVLRYHWLAGLQTTPVVRLEKVLVGNDPVGFIGIRTDDPVSHLVIENAYRAWDRH